MAFAQPTGTGTVRYTALERVYYRSRRTVWDRCGNDTALPVWYRYGYECGRYRYGRYEYSTGESTKHVKDRFNL